MFDFSSHGLYQSTTLIATKILAIDNTGGADRAFRLVESAWEILSDPKKKATYDRHLKPVETKAPPKNPIPRPATIGTKRAASGSEQQFNGLHRKEPRRRAVQRASDQRHQKLGLASILTSRKMRPLSRFDSGIARVENVRMKTRAIIGSWVRILLPFS